MSYSSAISLFLIGVGILLFSYSYSQQRKQVIKNKFLIQKNDKRKAPNIFIGWLDGILPSTIALNEETIKQKLNDAGTFSFKYARFYLPGKYAILLLGGAAIGIAAYNVFSTLILIAILAGWTVLIVVLPDMILEARVKAYRNSINRQLPYLIDLLAVCVQTGMTIESSLGYLADEMHDFDIKLSRLLHRLNDRASIAGLDQALDELYEHIPTPEMRSFAMTLKQSLQYGSSIYNTLITLSSDIRQVTMLTVEERIGKLAAKMSVPLILFIMMPIVILIAAPGAMRMLSGV